MKKIVLYIVLIAGSISLNAQDADSLTIVDANENVHLMADDTSEISKADADSAYINNDFATAIDLYETLLHTRGASASVYYNLGNSYFKVDDIAKAILNYERANLLKPNDPDIHFNLEMARSKTVDKILPTNEIFFVTWFKSVASLLNVDGWAKTAIGCFILLIIALSIYVFSKRIVLKKIGFAGFILLFIFVIIINIFAYYQKDLLTNRNEAIIMAPSVTVTSTPNINGTELFILHEGHKVTIKDGSMREWKEIKLADGNVGWVPADVIEII